MRKRFFTPVITDAHAGNRTLTGGELLAVGIALAFWLRKNVPEKRVGIVLPPGIGATIANLGVLLAGKIPVNLNFTAGRAANESAMARAGIQRLITAPGAGGADQGFPLAGEPDRYRRADAKVFLRPTLKRWGLIAGWLRRCRCCGAGSACRKWATARKPRCSSPAAARASRRRWS